MPIPVVDVRPESGPAGDTPTGKPGAEGTFGAHEAAGGLVVATSHADDPALAVEEIVGAIGPQPLGGALVFCSHRYPRAELAAAIDAALPGVPLLGCISAGELSPAGYDSDSLLLVGFPAGDFSLATIRFEDLDHLDVTTAQRAIRRLVASERVRHQAAVGPAQPVHQVAVVFVDGLSHREELLTMTVQEALGDIQLIGGSSGDGLAFRETAVLHEGAFHSGAAVVGLITSTRALHTFCANHYRPGPAKMVITEADPETRTVHEINAAPAAEEYRRLVGDRIGLLDAHVFAAHPPMVRIGGRYHVRSVQSVNPDGSLTFYCAIDTGIVLTIGEPVDRIAGMRQLFDDVEAQVGEIDRIIAFDCILNRLDAEDRQIARDVSKLYVEKNVIGFNTYGEQYRSAHMNQTFSGLAVGR